LGPKDYQSRHGHKMVHKTKPPISIVKSEPNKETRKNR